MHLGDVFGVMTPTLAKIQLLRIASSPTPALDSSHPNADLVVLTSLEECFW